ncbi:hypothetical protein LSM04_002543 [Trypanosoma melophagium]|nr:hypothetical protein LSM04_002543 [Trypanosoma melophagium]
MESLSPSQSRTSFDDSGMATLSSPNCRGLTTVLEYPINVSKQNGMTRPYYYYRDNDNDEEKERKQLRREAYAENAAILREVFCHPLLADAPLLIVSNKSDRIEHASLEEIQESLGLVEMALMHQVYDDYSYNCEEGSSRRKSHSVNSDENSDGFAASLTPTTVTAAAEMIPGTSGIGTKIMRLAEISALNGTGVREAMDWLVVQMRESKRVAETKDE